MTSVEFIVESHPPAYDSGKSVLNPSHPRYPLVQELQKVARKAMKGRGLLRGVIALEVEHEIFMGDRRTDAVNLIAGIANVLERIVYATDNQIKEVHFKQLASKRDLYKVKVRELV